MLLEFRVNNYKSFSEEAVFSLEASSQSGLEYSIHKRRLGRKVHKVLCSSIIYGPNASGKTTLIGALDAFKNIVLRGNLRNADGHASVDKAAFSLELIPNSQLEVPRPVTFGIKFFEGKDLFEYEVHANLGAFLDSEYKRSVAFERLVINADEIFVRDGNTVAIGELGDIRKYLSQGFVENEEAARSFANNLIEDELFLTGGFKSLVNAALSGRVTTWFEKSLTVIYRADQIRTLHWVDGLSPQAAFIEKSTEDAAKLFGVTSNSLGYMMPEGESEPKLCSLLRNPDGKSGHALNAEVYESYGTIRFVNLFPLIVHALKTGGVLIVDEFDASIHPMALMSIINVFHNDDVNKLGAQLVFNTHNPIFLNKNLFRRDEIKFVERDHDTGSSSCYSLSDFGTAGSDGVRKGADYMKEYFVSRYGAIEDVDFTPLFEDLMAEPTKDGDHGE